MLYAEVGVFTIPPDWDSKFFGLLKITCKLSPTPPYILGLITYFTWNSVFDNQLAV